MAMESQVGEIAEVLRGGRKNDEVDNPVDCGLLFGVILRPTLMMGLIITVLRIGLVENGWFTNWAVV